MFSRKGGKDDRECGKKETGRVSRLDEMHLPVSYVLESGMGRTPYSSLLRILVLFLVFVAEESMSFSSLRSISVWSGPITLYCR